MRLCIVSHLYPVDAADYKGVHVHQMAAALAARGHVVHVVTPRRIGSAAREERDGVRIERYRYWGWWRGWQLSELAGYSPLTLASLFLIGIWKTFWCVLLRRCELIHAYWVVPGGFIAALVGALLRRPVVATAAGTDLNMAGRKKLVRVFVRAALKGADRVIAAGSDMKRLAIELGGREAIVLPSCFAAMPGGEPRPVEIPGRPGGRVLWVGSLDPPKRPDIVIRAFAKIHGKRPGAALIVAGQGQKRETLEGMAAGLAGESVRFLGSVPHEQVVGLMAAADVFVHCSEYEGLPVAIVEALRAGLPVVARRVGGVPDLVRDGENGYLIDELDADAFAERIGTLLERDDIRRSMADAARRFAKENLDGAAVVKHIERIYSELVK
ncbi:MAG: glycosyltransferase [Candidatus Sumerlaeia bacterium]